MLAEQNQRLGTLETGFQQHRESLPTCFVTQEESLLQSLQQTGHVLSTEISKQLVPIISTTGASRGPSLQIAPFSGGACEDFRAWLENDFKLKFRASKARILVGFLSAHALFLYKGLTEDIKDDYAKVTKELETKLLTEDRKRFITHQYEVRAKKQMKS